MDLLGYNRMKWLETAVAKRLSEDIINRQNISLRTLKLTIAPLGAWPHVNCVSARQLSPT